MHIAPLSSLPTSAQNRLGAVRAEIKAVTDKIYEVQHAPVPIEEAVDRVSNLVDRFAAGANLPRFVASFSAADMGRHSLDALGEHFMPAICALFGDELKANLAKAVRAAPPADSVAAADRPKQIEDLRSRRFALETQEERLLASGDTTDFLLPRRDELDPVAFFAAYDTPAAAVAKIALLAECSEQAGAALNDVGDRMRNAKGDFRRAEGRLNSLDKSDVVVGRNSAGQLIYGAPPPAGMVEEVGRLRGRYELLYREYTEGSKIIAQFRAVLPVLKEYAVRNKFMPAAAA